MRTCPFSLVVAIILGAVTYASACPDGQYEGLFGMCMPEIGGAVGQSFEHLKREIPAQILGNPLEPWIIGSRNTSINGAQPIPSQIRQALTGYSDAGAMNVARFKVGDPGVLNLAGLSIRYGDVSAVTLIDVIVFRDTNDAYNNPALWAHELMHVKQFSDWGVHNFAISYMRNVNDVEGPAYSVGNGYAQWRFAHPIVGPFASLPFPAPPVGPPPLQQGFPSGFGMQVCGCWGPTSGYAVEPRCQSGGVRINMCPGICPGGAWPYAWVCQ
jgi:Domain of unknown function (DUF4157)